MSFDRTTRLRASVIESHAAQLRSEAMAFLHQRGEEYAEALSEIIGGIMEEPEPNKWIVGCLAEIGMCAVITGEVNAAGEP